MRADGGYRGLDADWARVSAARPCTICSGLEGRAHVDEAFACCVHEPSERRLSNGGWLQRITRGAAALAVGLALAPEGALGEVPPGVSS
jgi:hypothetical protein